MFKNLIYKLKRPYHFIKTGLLKGVPAQIKYGFPEKKLKIIIITGTDGKTTSSTLLYNVLKSAGKKVGLISTVAAYIGDKEIETGLHVTAPGPKKLRQFMKKMKDKKFEYLVLEFTSHGAYQYRNWGIKPLITGVTNVTHEHLDYHINYQQYIKAKFLLLKNSQTVILNGDDKSYLKFRKLLNLKKQNVISYSAEDKVNGKAREGALGQKISRTLNQIITKKFPEKYNQMNARLVAKIAQNVGIEDKDIAKGLQTFQGVPGRMQFVPIKKNFQVVVDFAHTPNALEAALMALREKMRTEKSRGNLIAVFGCAGARDKEKRPMMGKVAVELADLAIFTAEDPRSEDVWAIIRQMKEQVETDHNKIISIADRKKAIEYALTKLAKKGDIVGIFGKGPEKSMCYGTTEYPWSDEGAVKEILS